MLTLLQKLDTVLLCLEKHHSEKHHDLISIATILQKENPDVKFGELTSILNKLHKDQYIDIVEVEMPNTESINKYYSINFEGRIYNEQGGYNQQRINNISESIRVGKIEHSQNHFRSIQNVLLFLVAAGTLIAAAYYLHELFWQCR